MTKEEARIIFKSWQDYMEIAEKFHILMLFVPESFLPYPARTIEEALVMIAKEFQDSGNTKMVELIQNSMGYFLSHFFMGEKQGAMQTDGEAITKMKKMLDMIEENTDLKKTMLARLRECQNGWIESRRKQFDE